MKSKLGGPHVQSVDQHEITPELFAKVLRVVKNENNWYGYDDETKTFYLILPNGKPLAINFITRSGRELQSTLFEIIYRNWETNKDKSMKASIPISKIMTDLNKLQGEDLDRNRFRSNFRHLKEKIDGNKYMSSYFLMTRDMSSIYLTILNPNDLKRT